MTDLLYKPSQQSIDRSQMTEFINLVNEKYQISLQDYSQLHQWSVDNVENFWQTFADYSEFRFSKPYSKVLKQTEKMQESRWFIDGKLNFAENLLKYSDDRVAIISITEHAEKIEITYAELNDRVVCLAAAMTKSGIVVGDRVVAYMPNIPETIIAMLAATSLGAVFSSCSPDFGTKGVVDRFGQIKPKILVTVNGYSYKGKIIDLSERLNEIKKQLPSVEKVLVHNFVDLPENANSAWEDFYSFGLDAESMSYQQVGFDHAVYVMYSSGTTGLPKCMVQGAGVLLNHLKELRLHCDLTRDDTIFYYTTCGWMMWNWLVSSLAVGARVVLFDGNPFYPDAYSLLNIVKENEVTVFGTSAKYIDALEESKVTVAKDYLPTLRLLLSTGSPLSDSAFHYVYREIKKNIQLSSIAGGTDLNGCFAIGNPILPVYSSEAQCKALAMDVKIFDDKGQPVVAQQGELVCCKPFPSMPLYFYNDPDGSKYYQAYFDVYKNIWRHGDFVEETKNGGLIFFGRSDATLNPGGVRIGTAEIYRNLEAFSEIEDSVVVGQKWLSDERVILFVKLSQGASLDDALVAGIKKRIKDNVSPRHVPAKVLAIGDIPYTKNMKKVEIAVKNVIHGRPVKNREALANPEAIELYVDLKELNN